MKSTLPNKRITLFYKIAALVLVLLINSESFSQSGFISFNKTSATFPIVSANKATALLIDNNDWPGVLKISGLFQKDIESVSGHSPDLLHEIKKSPKERVIIIGTLGKSELIDLLIKKKKLDASAIENKWESTLIQVVEKPFKGVDEALVIAGSDKRGTIYGMFDISRKIGVSPWYWWSDVPTKKHPEIYINKEKNILEEPKVKYRGIFLNDEEPALGRWAVENYGGFNHQFYEQVFELILRLKGNFLWPAMWWAAFNSDDPKNQKLADEMGIVMSTSHHEPMMRAHAEWKKYKGGEWNFTTNKEGLTKFWKEGVERMGNYESVVTLAMRGDGDEAMSDDTNTKLLEEIVEHQRQIITEVTGKPIEEIPQVWALYKEVQEYYDKGMRVPDDVTLLLCDDNWGNVRVLPNLKDKPRKGGYGMYYHFDYVGGPRCYKWLNTSPLPHIWEQMNLTYRYGVDRIWLVNVGDLKPMELPISFFLDMAWNPNNITTKNIDDYTTIWATEQFGEKYAKEIGKLLKLYPKYNARRKPESLFSNTFSLTNYNEFEQVVADYNKLEERAKNIYNVLEENQKDAYYQLVYHPIQACSNLYNLYYYHAKNLLYAEQGRTATNDMALKVKELFAKDAEITKYYHTELSNGKWNHMMAQTHIGYDNWQQPKENKMPEVKTIKLPEAGELKFSIEGSKEYWPNKALEAKTPIFDSFNKQEFSLELFNTGTKAVDYKLSADKDWVLISSKEGSINTEKRIILSVDWNKVTEKESKSSLNLFSQDKKIGQIIIEAKSYKEKATGFVENNGYVSIEAPDFTGANNTEDVYWDIIPGLGRTKGGVSAFPVTKTISKESKEIPYLEYEFYLSNESKDKAKANIYLSPVLNFKKGEGLYFGVSIDDKAIKYINIHEGTEVPDWKYPNWWNQMVLNNSILKTVELGNLKAGKHTLKIWRIDPGIVLQKIVINNGGLEQSYLGPPESKLIE